MLRFGCDISKKEAKVETIRRYLQRTESSFFLFGPRGTGKSTWLKQCFPNAIYIDLLDPASFRLYMARPERLGELIEGNPNQNWIIIDEVQKIPELLAVVHQQMERSKDLRFVLTGSSSRKLKRTGVDLLSGRALLKTCHPFMASELESDFDLDIALKYGTLPVVLNSCEPDQVLKAYAALYLREEVQMEGLIRDIGGFARFLEAISFSHASTLNTSEVARDCEVGRKTVEGYIEILEDLLLGIRIPVFTKKAKRILTAHSKFYYFDTGVYRSLRPMGPLDNPQIVDGASLEGLILQHLRAWCEYGDNNDSLYYWRTKSGIEVDFIVYGKDTFYAIEVKNSARVRHDNLKGLKAFKEDYPNANLLFLYRGKEKLKIDDVLCVPCDEFLLRLKPNVPLSEI